MLHNEHWIDGRQVPSRGLGAVEVPSPVSGHLVSLTSIGDAHDVAAAARSSRDAQPMWADHSPSARAEILRASEAALRRDLDRLVELERAETGKPHTLAVEEMLASADYFGYYAAVARTLGGETFDVGGDRHVYTVHEPFGLVAVITPWNYSVNQASRSIAPALAAGNAVVLKPSEWTSAATLAMAQIVTAAGVPPGVLNVVCGDGPGTGAALVADPRVRRVSFTGSIAAGRRVASLAAERLIPVTLELGGKSPHVVFADADLDRAAETTVAELVYNAGQTCSAGTRLLVEASVHEQVLERVIEAIAKSQDNRELGPIITQSQFDRINALLEQTAKQGVVAATGGTPVTGRYVAPAVFADVDPQLSIAREEVFGPVLVTMPFADERAAIELANDTPYGLVAGVWTRDLDRAYRVAGRLEAGQIYVNGWGAPIEAPFGGVKDSGYGREKGRAAVGEYTRVKTVSVTIGRD
jgi:acyl-CoA reductase-like NAD-dependent aldehyde dehydrogenase